VDVDDVVLVNLRFRNGATGSLSTMLSTPRQWRVQVFGTSQWAHMRDENLLDLSSTGHPIESKTFDPVDTLRLELESFAAAIGGGEAYKVSTSDALHGVAALEAILDSAANAGSLVPVKTG
jgi:predicted dehydrogenase